jgi:hypothetical protein
MSENPCHGGSTGHKPFLDMRRERSRALSDAWFLHGQSHGGIGPRSNHTSAR